MTPRFLVCTHASDVYKVLRIQTDGTRTMTSCVHMTGCRLEAERMRVELEKADRQAFYEGLIVGHSERAQRRRLMGLDR